MFQNTRPNKEDLLTLTCVDRWYQTVQSEVEDIRAWRGHEEERAQHADDSTRCWGEMPERLLGDTFHITSRITAGYKNLDTKPIADIYEVVEKYSFK